MKTLAYDCGNPVQYVCGHPPAVLFLFTGSPRSFHSLSMTKGTKWIIPQSLTTPAASRHPSNGGELGTYRCGIKFPSMEGCPQGGVVCYPQPILWATHPRDENAPMPTAQLRSKSPFTTDGTATPVPSRSKFPSAEGWHEVPGWFIIRSVGEG